MKQISRGRRPRGPAPPPAVPTADSLWRLDGLRMDVQLAWGVDGPWGRRGCSRGGSPQSKGSGAAPGSPLQAPIFWAFLTDFHEVLLLFWDQLKPKNGYKYSHSSC